MVVSKNVSIHGSHPGLGEERPEKDGRKEFRGSKRAEIGHHGFEIYRHTRSFCGRAARNSWA
ncbi:MAG: hypothetical protein WCP70_10550 [Methanothrix sp.]